jgi:uncharacterized RDD family membrane protein YckC
MSRAGGADPGSAPIAAAGPRFGAFLVDVVTSGLVAFVFTAPELPQNRSLAVFVVIYFAGTLFVQQTPGMRLLRLRVVRTDRPVPVGLWRSAVRTLGVVLVVPAALRDREGRALHDRLTRTAVVADPRPVPA